MAKKRKRSASGKSVEGRVFASAGQWGTSVSIAPRGNRAVARWKAAKSKSTVRRVVRGVLLDSAGKPKTGQLPQFKELARILATRLVKGESMPQEPAGPTWEALWRLAGASMPKKPKPSDPKNPRDTQDVPAPAGLDDGVLGKLTVRDALAAAYGPSYADQMKNGRISGKFARSIRKKDSGGAAVSTWTEHARELRRLADIVEQILGSRSPWDPSEDTYNKLRDEMIRGAAAKYASDRGAKPKMSRTQKVLQNFIRATRLVRRKYGKSYPAQTEKLDLPRWLTDLRQQWEAEFSTVETDQPRYSPRELARLYAFLREETDDQRDPRLALYFELGGQGRPSQVLRATRANIDDSIPGAIRGVFRTPGVGKKKGLVYAFTPAHRVEVNRYLRGGFLREFEEQYRKGKIRDYPLFPAGTVIDGVIPFRLDAHPIDYRQLLGERPEAVRDEKRVVGFYRVEAAVNIPHVELRGFYGIKRGLADLVPIAAKELGIGDPAALNLATGHDTPGTSSKYRTKARENILLLSEVGKIVWKMRELLRTRFLMEDVAQDLDLSPVNHQVEYFETTRSGITVEIPDRRVLFVPWTAVEQFVPPERRAETARAITHMMHGEGSGQITVGHSGDTICLPRWKIDLSVAKMIERANRNEDAAADDVRWEVEDAALV